MENNKEICNREYTYIAHLQNGLIRTIQSTINSTREELKAVFKNPNLNEDTAYCYFHHMMSTDNKSGLLRTDILSGSILFLKDKGLGNTSTSLYNEPNRDLIFCIRENTATFLTSDLMIICENYHTPGVFIKIKSKKLMGDKDVEYAFNDLDYNQWKFVISEIAVYVATLLTRQYKKSSINKI